MLAAEAASAAAAWQLLRVAVPGLGWFLAATSQLAGNALSKVLPGGGAAGGALTYRMWERAGVDPGGAAGGLAAGSLVSTAVLFALAPAAFVAASATAPVPRGLAVAAATGALAFFLVLVAGAGLAVSDRVAAVAGRAVAAAARLLGRVTGRADGLSAKRFVEQRDETVAALGRRWRSAGVAAVANWVFDYAALVLALHGAGADPRPSLVLLAYAVAAVLSMIPIMPGGLGFVEAGLVSTLALAGVPAAEALVATLAYRLVAYWLPLLLGGPAYLLYRRRRWRRARRDGGVDGSGA